MGFHTYPMSRADDLEDVSRYRFLSREELLGLLDPDPEWTVADLGSGTGFYTDEVAPYVADLHAVDVQAAMHDYYREKGAPANVAFVTAEVADLPFADGELDGAFSTMTFHEFAEEESLAELARVLRPGGRVAVADWTRAGEGEEGPSVDERYDLDAAVEMLVDAGFEIRFSDERPETFVVAAEI